MNEIVAEDLLYKSYVVQEGTALCIKTVELLVEEEDGLWVYLKSNSQTCCDEEWIRYEDFLKQIS
jgi:hypothetical protein